MCASKRFYVLYFLVFFLVVQVNGFAQIGKDKWGLTIEAALPSGLKSNMYRNYLNGLVSIQPKLHFKTKSNVYVAAGPKYAYYTISEFKVPKKMTGGLHTYGGFAEVGYQKWVTKYFGMEYAFKVGYEQHQFITSLTRISGVQKINSMYYCPQLSLILAADEATAYRWIIGYNIDGYNFNPNLVGIDEDKGYTADETKGPAQSLVVGFAFSYYFGNKRSDDVID